MDSGNDPTVTRTAVEQVAGRLDIDFGPHTPADWLSAAGGSVEENLALDEALLEEAHEGLAPVTVVRTWMAAEPTIVLGSSSRIDDEVDRDACARLGVRLARRPSGGLTVVLGPGCLMWSVVIPRPHGPPPIEAIHDGPPRPPTWDPVSRHPARRLRSPAREPRAPASSPGTCLPRRQAARRVSREPRPRPRPARGGGAGGVRGDPRPRRVAHRSGRPAGP